MRKENIKGTIDELVDKFEKQIDRFKHHLYIFRSQYKYLRTRKLNLKQNECLIHVDFSENYEGKMASEVQGMNSVPQKDKFPSILMCITQAKPIIKPSAQYQTTCIMAPEVFGHI